MHIFSTQAVEREAVDAKGLFGSILNCRVKAVIPLGGGRNSRVYEVSTDSSDKYAGKVYFSHILDERDRLGTEFGGLTFLWNQGVRCIPRPLLEDRERGCAIYQFIEGVKIRMEDVTSSDVLSAASFLANLDALKKESGSEDLPPASEACFSISAIIDNIGLRLKRFLSCDYSQPGYRALEEFLNERLKPFFSEAREWSIRELEGAGISCDEELSLEQRALSPSDFGFHNALRRPDGTLVFLDFEYFGWDDPAKTISDFLLHPAMDFGDDRRKLFTGSIYEHFAYNTDLAKRLEGVFPLFGIKWALILLNEFLPEHMQRRRFAQSLPSEEKFLLSSQLMKSEGMINRVKKTYTDFSYRSRKRVR